MSVIWSVYIYQLKEAIKKRTNSEKTGYRVCSASTKCRMTEDRERIVRLETRTREAEITIQQLRAYIDLLKKKAGRS